MQHTDSPAPMQVAEKRGKLAFGQASDMKAFGPNAQLTALGSYSTDPYQQFHYTPTSHHFSHSQGIFGYDS